MKKSYISKSSEQSWTFSENTVVIFDASYFIVQHLRIKILHSIKIIHLITGYCNIC